MKSVLYLVTVAVIFLLEGIDGNQFQKGSNLSCALIPGQSKSIFYEPILDYIWIRRSCIFGRVFSDYYCICVPTQLMLHTRRNTQNSCIFRGSKSYMRRADPKSIYYQERVRTTKWKMNTCKSGLIFSPTHCRCIENNHETCQYLGGITRTRKQDTDVNYFQQLTNSNRWERIKCFNGATFSLTKCSCIFGDKTIIVTTPEPENNIKICKNPKYGYLCKSDSNPRHYLQKNINNKWEKKVCEAGGIFSSALCECIYHAKPTSESEITPKVEPDTPLKFCLHIPSNKRRGTYRDEHYYYELRGNSWKKLPCQNGFIFNYPKCCCVLKSKQITNPQTEPTSKPTEEPEVEPEPQFEICPHKPSKSIRRATANPQIYKQMTKGGKWTIISCQGASQFNVKKCCCVPTSTTPAQPTSAEPEIFQKVCRDKSSNKQRRAFENERYYYELKGSFWKLIACQNGYVFCIDKCCCVSKSKQITNPETEPGRKPEKEPTGEPETTPKSKPEGEPEIAGKNCLHKPSNKRRKTTKVERVYYEETGSTWTMKACDIGYIFCLDKCCCVSKSNQTTKPETEPESKPETEPESKPESKPEGKPEGEPEIAGKNCLHKPSNKRRKTTKVERVYYEETGSTWTMEACQNGYVFRYDKCCCVLKSKHITNPEAESEGKPESKPEGKAEGEPKAEFELQHAYCIDMTSGCIKKNTTNPLQYKQLSPSFKWEVKYCPSSKRFSLRLCCCVPTTPGQPGGEPEDKPKTNPEPKPENKPETEPEGKPEPQYEICPYLFQTIRKGTANSRIYKEMTKGGYWVIKSCSAASRFDTSACNCVPIGKTTPEQPGGEPEGKPKIKPEPEGKPEPKPETKPETEPEGRPETMPKTEPKYKVQVTRAVCRDQQNHLRQNTPDLRYYLEWKYGTTWETKICDENGIFNSHLCCCVYPAEITYKQKN